MTDDERQMMYDFGFECGRGDDEHAVLIPAEDGEDFIAGYEAGWATR